jgi:hypothetical protein
MYILPRDRYVLTWTRCLQPLLLDTMSKYQVMYTLETSVSLPARYAT